MLKKRVPGMDNKAILKARAKDRLYRFLMADDQVRGAVIHGTHMVREMMTQHNLGILETLLLGHAYLGIGLITANLKGNDRVAFKVECEGPIQGLTVEASARGEVRGHLKVNPIPLDKPLESFNLAPLFGQGFLQVISYPESAKQPYTGQVKLRHGSIAMNLAHYYLTSEQTPTAFNLSVKFDKEGNVVGAGGVLLQTLPDFDKSRVDELEQIINNLPSIGDLFETGEEPENFINSFFHSFSPRVLGNRRIEFFCACNQKTVGQLIGKLPKEQLLDILEKGPFPLETRCHNCNTVYSFQKKEIQGLVP